MINECTIAHTVIDDKIILAKIGIDLMMLKLPLSGI